MKIAMEQEIRWRLENIGITVKEEG